MRFNATTGSSSGGEERRRGDWLSCYDARLALNPVTEYISLPNSRQNARQRSNLSSQAYPGAPGDSLSLLLSALFLFVSLSRFATLLPKYIGGTGSQLDFTCVCVRIASSRLCKRIKTETKQSFCCFLLFPSIFEREHRHIYTWRLKTTFISIDPSLDCFL